MFIIKIIQTSLLLLLSFNLTVGQDISSFKKLKPLSYSSGVQLGTYYSASQGRTSITSPYGFYINGNLNVSVYGFRFPLTISIRDQKFNYTKPMFRLGMSPSYKWAKLYIGNAQMMFNNYTLAGMTFYGGGVSLTPGKLRFNVMAGNMESPRAILDSIQGSRSYIQPYKRFGMGAKLGFGSQYNYVDLMIFNGKDRSVAIEIPDSISLKPSENTVVGLQSQLSLFKNILQLQWNLGASLLTSNINGSPLEVDSMDRKYLAYGEKLMSINNSTRLNYAGDALIRLNFQNFHIGAKYQYIDPSYTSLGAYYFKDDNENYTLDFGTSLFKNRFSLDASYGIQRNNVAGHRSLGTEQKIYDISSSLNISPSLGINAQYSNFNFNQVSGLVQIDDSLRFGQINANTSISPYLNFGTKNIKQSIVFSYSDQKIKDLSFNEISGNDANVKSINLSHNLNHKPQTFSINTSLQYLQNVYSGLESSRIGLFVTGQKSFLKNNFSSRLQINYSKNKTNGLSDGNQYGGNAGLNYKMGKRNTFSLQINYVDRNTIIRKSYSEWRASTSLNIQLK
jgi:hypothetical protein